MCSLPQAHQERAYQKFCATKAVEKAQQQEGYYEQLVAVNQSEMACIPKRCSTALANLEQRQLNHKFLLDNTLQFSSKVSNHM